jgi:hypothetical protein
MRGSVTPRRPPELGSTDTSSTVEEVDAGVRLPFFHRPLGRYVNGLADRGLYVTGMIEPEPPARFLALAPEYATPPPSPACCCGPRSAEKVLPCVPPTGTSRRLVEEWTGWARQHQPSGPGDRGANSAAMIRSLAEIDRALRASWSADTCSPDDAARAPWTADNPAWGHCDVTALVVNDLLGGDLVVGEVHVDGEQHGYHWWNRLPSGIEIDLTREQFRDGQVVTSGRTVKRPAGLPRHRSDGYVRFRGRVRSMLGPVPLSLRS